MVYSNLYARKILVAARKQQPTTTAMVRHSERTMSQSNSDPDPESTDEREEENEIKHISLEQEESVPTIS